MTTDINGKTVEFIDRKNKFFKGWRPIEKSPGYIYFLQSPSIGGLIKIGKTNNLLTRMESHKTSNPSFRLIHFFSGWNISQIESLLHTLLNEYRVSGQKEWFSIDAIDKIPSEIKVIASGNSNYITINPRFYKVHDRVQDAFSSKFCIVDSAIIRLLNYNWDYSLSDIDDLIKENWDDDSQSAELFPVDAIVPKYITKDDIKRVRLYNKKIDEKISFLLNNFNLDYSLNYYHGEFYYMMNESMGIEFCKAWNLGDKSRQEEIRNKFNQQLENDRVYNPFTAAWALPY